MTDAIDTIRPEETNTFNGTRKLVRPRLPVRERRHDPHAEDPLSHAMQDSMPTLESSHAEAFYFQKQIQQQTDLTVVLEDGEQLHGFLGVVYDRCVIKLRVGRQRVLIYKACIKYLFKTSEVHAGATIMK